jgi:hypothetical protein
MEEMRGGNRGAWTYEGKMIDAPVILRAFKILHKARDWNIQKEEVVALLADVANGRTDRNSRRRTGPETGNGRSGEGRLR